MNILRLLSILLGLTQVQCINDDTLCDLKTTDLSLSYSFNRNNLINKSCQFRIYESNQLDIFSDDGLILNKNFDLNNMFQLSSRPNIRFLNVHNLKGIDMNSINLQIQFNNSNIKILQLVYIKFLFYHDNNLIDNCDQIVSNNKSISLFKNLNVYLIIDVTKYIGTMCPLVFQDSFIEHLSLSDFTNSGIIKNYLKVEKNFETKHLNSSIIQLTLNRLYRIDLNIELLNVFDSIQILNLKGRLQSIQFDLFKNFDNLKSINFVIDNTRELINKGLNWTNNMSDRLNGTKIEINMDWILKFPEEDFCLFKMAFTKSFIHSPVLFFKYIKYDTPCSMIILLNKWPANMINSIKQFNLTYFYYRLIECLKKYDKCDHSEIDYFDQVDSQFILFNVEYYLLNIFQPFLIILGLFLNLTLILILILKKFKTSTFNANMYQYLRFNSIFSSIYLIILIYGYIDICVLNFIFYCPDLQRLATFRVLTIIKFFLMDVISFCSGVIVIFFTLETLISMHFETTRFSLKFSKISIIKNILLIIILSILLNASKLLIFNIETNITYNQFPNMKFSWFYNKPNPDLKMVFLIQLIFDISIEYVLCVLNLIINYIILYQHRKNSTIKVNIFFRRTNAKAEKNNSIIVKMILFYGLSNFIFKFSKNSIYTWASFNFVKNECLRIDSRNALCVSDVYYPALEISNIIYNISFIFNIFIIYKSNNLIREKVNEFFYVNPITNFIFHR